MRRVALALPLLVLPLAGCGDDAAGTEAEGEPIPCVDDSQCPSGQTCIDNFCGGMDGGMPDGAVGPPQITVDPSMVDFGAPLIGSETTLSVTIANIGGDTLIIAGITLVEEEDPDLANEFTLSEETYPILIARGQSHVVEVTLRPVDGEADTGYLLILNNDPDEADSTKRVDLVSEVKGDPVLLACVHTTYPPPGPCEAEEILDFGAVPFAGSGARVFSVYNAGDGNRTIEVEDIDMSSTDHFDVETFEWTGGAEVAADLPFLLRPGCELPGTPEKPCDPGFEEPNRLYVRVTFTPSDPPPIDGLVPAVRVVVETDLDPSDDWPCEDNNEYCIPVTGTIVGCRPGYVDGDGNPANGCEYECTPTGVSETICNGVDDDCEGGSDEEYTPSPCGVGECISTSTCIGGVEDCVEDLPDNDDDCDGLDDDCDGTPDDDWVAGTCGLGICTATATCVAGVESCLPGPAGTETCNGGVDDDCDGSADEEDPGDAVEGAGSCSGAVSIGSVDDAAGDSLVASGVIHAGDEDWYAVTATDDAAEGCGAAGDEFDFRVCWITNPGSDLRLDVHRGSCPPAGSSCTNVDDIAQWDFTCPDATDCCSGDGATGADIGAVFYIRVYRTPGEPVDCSTYTFKVANGGAPCP